VSRSAFRCVCAVKRRCSNFQARERPVRIQQKARWDTLRQTCIFASGGICVSRRALWCVRGVKRRHIIFMLGWARCSFHEKCTGTHYAELMILHPMGFAGHVVHSVAFGLQNIDALFFMLGWGQYGFHEKRVGTRYVKFVFFSSSGICGSRSAFRCVQGTKCRRTIFKSRVRLIPHRDMLRRICVFASSGICGSCTAFE
jgi:hypothetical protein